VGSICLQLSAGRSLFQHRVETLHWAKLPVTLKYLGLLFLNTDQHVLGLPSDELAASQRNVLGTTWARALLTLKNVRESATRRVHTIRAMRWAAGGWIMDTKCEGMASFHTLARAMQAAGVHISPFNAPTPTPRFCAFRYTSSPICFQHKGSG
jgi:hypothetical protein